MAHLSSGEAKDASGLQCYLVKIYRWVQTWHSAPFMITIAGLFKSQSLEGFSRGPNSLSQPSTLVPQSLQGVPSGMDVDRPGLFPALDQLFLLGWAWQTSSLSTCPGSLSPLPSLEAHSPVALLLVPGAQSG